MKSITFSKRKLRPKGPESGFTVVELMVVIAAIGLLLTLILPAVQHSREKARCVTCVVRLKDLGTGLHGYESIHRHLPAAGGKLNVVASGVWIQAFSVHMHLTPFLGYQAVYDTIQKDCPLDRNAVFPPGTLDPNHGIRTQHLPVFLCPSDPNSAVGRNSYRACVGGVAFPRYTGPPLPQPRYGGAFSPISHMPRLQQIIDGLSNTAAMSERLVGDFDNRRYNTGSDVFHVSAVVDPNTITISPQPDDDFVAACGGLTNPSPMHDSTIGEYWLYGGLADTLYNHLLPPNSSIPDCGSISGTLGGGVITARSAHDGGVNLLLMDGSVRLVANSISSSVWISIGGRSDGDTEVW